MKIEYVNECASSTADVPAGGVAARGCGDVAADMPAGGVTARGCGDVAADVPADGVTVRGCGDMAADVPAGGVAVRGCGDVAADVPAGGVTVRGCGDVAADVPADGGVTGVDDDGLRREIVVTPEESRWLQRLFGCSGVTVWAALKYRKHNELHRRIRRAALERGNRQMVLAPEFETLFVRNRVDADRVCRRYMLQVFGNGAHLECCLDTGDVVLRDCRGVERGRWTDVPLGVLHELQRMAEGL